MLIRLYKFNKRHNSTKQPDTDGVEISVKLKDNTSIHSPHFLLTNVSVMQYNYLKWQDRYYYISDQIQVRNDLIEVYCSIDYLATYKTDIFNTNCLVEYATTNYINMMPDMRNACYGDLKYNFGSEVPEFTINTTIYYNVTFQSKKPLQQMYSSVFIRSTDFSDWMSSLYLEFLGIELYSPWKDIIEVKMCYLPTTLFEDVVWESIDVNSKFYFGVHEMTTTKQMLYTNNKYISNDNFNVSINWAYNDYRRNQPFSQLYVNLPGAGVTPLNNAEYLNKTNIPIKWYLDLITWTGYYYIGDETIIPFSWAIKMPVTMLYNSDMPQLSAINSFIGSSVASGGIGVADGLNAAQQFFNAGTPKTIGPGLGYLKYIASFKGHSLSSLYSIVAYYDTTFNPDDVVELIGRPLHRKVLLSTLAGGYISTTEASVSINNVDYAIAINNMLDSGVFLE